MSKPISQEVKLPKWAIAATWMADTSISVVQTTGVFLVTGDPFSTAGFGAYQLAAGVPSVNAEIRVLNSLVATVKNRALLKEIAKNEGAKNIKMLRTGYSKSTGIYTSELISKDFIFLELEDGKVPEATEMGEWIPMKDLDETKMRFNLQLPEGPANVPAVELSLSEIFEGKRIPQETLEQWRDSVAIWDKSNSLYERYIKQKEIEKISVQLTLIHEGEEKILGAFSQGSGVNSLLGETWMAKGHAMLFGEYARGQSGWGAKTTEVLEKGGCATWYKRMLGKSILPQ